MLYVQKYIKQRITCFCHTEKYLLGQVVQFNRTNIATNKLLFLVCKNRRGLRNGTRGLQFFKIHKQLPLIYYYILHILHILHQIACRDNNWNGGRENYTVLYVCIIVNGVYAKYE